MEKITNYTSREELKLHTQHVSNYAETVNKVWEAAQELLRTKYNGKRMTKLFCNDLNAKFADDIITAPDGHQYNNVNVSITEGFSYKELHIWVQKRSYQGPRGWVYFDKEIYGTSVTLYPEFFDAAGYIIADKLIKKIEQCIDGNLEKVAVLQDAVKNYDKYMKAYQKAKRAFLDSCGKINSMFVETEVRTYEYDTPWRVELETKLGTYKKQYN